MNIPCDKKVTCCQDFPLTNYSSEEPDRLVFLSAFFSGPGGPPFAPISFGVETGCTQFSSSLLSQVDADACGQRAAAECSAQTNLNDPCVVCRPAIPGNTFGFFSVNTGGEGGACCDPSAPQGCCCDPEPAQPDAPPGGGGGGGNDTPPPANPPRLFCNEPQSCEVQCGDGRKSSATVRGCQVYALSTAMANRIAHSMACAQAEEKLICYDDWGGGGHQCKVFCRNAPADFQLNATARDGSDISYDLVGGTLPPGLSIDEHGHITGTPTQLGESTVQLDLTDSSGTTATQTVCIRVMDITTTSLPNAAICSDYGGSVSADGGFSPYTFSVFSGTLPNGLTLNSDGTITGQPRVPGTYGFTAMVNDSAGNSCKKDLSITVTGISSQAQTVHCPNNPAIAITVPAGLFVPCGPYAGYDQASLNVLATQAAFNSLMNSCGCTGTNIINAPPNTETALFNPVGCAVHLYVTCDDLGVGFATHDLGIYGPGGGPYNLFSAINGAEGNPVWNPGCIPPIGNVQKPHNGTYRLWSDAGFTNFLFSVKFQFQCP